MSDHRGEISDVVIRIRLCRASSRYVVDTDQEAYDIWSIWFSGSDERVKCSSGNLRSRTRSVSRTRRIVVFDSRTAITVAIVLNETW